MLVGREQVAGPSLVRGGLQPPEETEVRSDSALLNGETRPFLAGNVQRFE